MISWIQTISLLTPLVGGSGGEEQPGLVGGGGEEQPGEVSLKELAARAFEDIDDMRVGGLLRAYYDNADSELSASGEDISAVRLYDAQVWFSAMAYGYDVFIRADAAEAGAFPPKATAGVISLELRDAFVRKGLTEELDLYFGQFKCPLVSSGNVGDGNLAMIERTRIGQLFSMPGAYQPGAALVYDTGPFHGKVVLQNGADSEIDGMGIVVRGEFRVGEGAQMCATCGVKPHEHLMQIHNEGAFGGAEGFNGTFGVGYFTDDSDIGGEDFGSAWAVDAYTTFNQASLHAEILSADEELASRALGNTTDDATPYSATAGYLFSEVWEAFLRYQGLDNEVDATIIGAGVNYYVAGHTAKWQFGVSQYDDDVIDGTVIQGGLSIGLSQPSDG